MMNHGRIVIILFALIASVAGTASAQNRLADAKALYDDASYEEALKLLDQVAISESAPEVHQYRALCLIALGRAEAAERAIALVVTADPFFLPNAEEIAPRVVAMFADIRRKLLPQVVRKAFAEARATFKEGDRQLADERFNEVLRLLADPSFASDPEFADLKLVAGGFVDLGRAQPASPQPAGANAPAATGASAAPASGPATTPGASTTPASTSGPSTPRVPEITRPIPISQSLPMWRPPDATAARWNYSGAVRVKINAEGKVTSSVMERSVHPGYDRVVLEAARSWTYKPATFNGKPIGSETVVEIKLEAPSR